MKNYMAILFIVGFVVISCKEEKRTETSQMKKVMAIHDEVMPKMSTLGNMVADLSEKEDSTEIGIKYMEARKELQEAHKSMMDWMRGFGERFDSDEILNGKELSAQKQKWLDEEEEKVKALRDQINGSIEKAKILLHKE
jgi:outer membrane translocation and assembly module TamA